MRHRRLGSAVVLLGLALLVAPLLAAWLAGWRLDVVRTASMEPEVPVHALAVTRPASATNVRVGDVIAFRDPTDPRQTILHRVAAIVTVPGKQGPHFRTRGDNNGDVDPWLVPADAVQRRLVVAVPRLGSIVLALSSGPARAALVGVPVLLVVLGELRRPRRRRWGDQPVPDEPSPAETPAGAPAGPAKGVVLLGAAVAGAAVAATVGRRRR